MKLYNLTSIPFALSNLALGRLKISRISELNDPFELMSANTNDISQRNALEKFKEQTNDSRGLICFSESFTNPVLWGHYADSHCGVALGFEIDAGLLLPVTYTPIKFDLPINPLTNQVECDEETLDKLLTTKFIDWKYENEWRFFCTLETSVYESGLYFERFSNKLYLTEVVLGAKCDLPIDEMQSFINKLGYKIQVKKAKFANDKFEVLA